MHARLIGFVWRTGKGITFDEFFEQLKSLRGELTRFGNYDRLLYTGETQEYFVGLFLTVKDQRRACEIRDLGGEFKINVRALADGTSLTDFNFFIVSKGTGRGLYQHYHNSCSFNQFSIFCSRQYDDLRESRREADLVPEGGDEAPGIAKRKIAEKYKGGLEWEVMVRQEKLQELLEELKIINFIEYEVATFTADEPTLTPLEPFVKKETRRLRFHPDMTADGLRSRLGDFVRRGNMRQGRVVGRDHEGIERIYRLLENPDSFGQYEYEDLADEHVLNLEDVAESPFVKEMLSVVEKNKTIFLTPTK